MSGDIDRVARHLLEADVLRNTSSVICDLCDRMVPPKSVVYTCSSGETTVLHATEYDICRACFLDFAVRDAGDDVLPTRRTVGPRDDASRPTPEFI